MVCSSKLTMASARCNKCHGQVRRQKASTAYQGRCLRRATTVSATDSGGRRTGGRSRGLPSRPGGRCVPGRPPRRRCWSTGPAARSRSHRQNIARPWPTSPRRPASAGRRRVLRPRREKGGGGNGTAWRGGAVSAKRGSAGVWPAWGRGAVASARVTRSRPNFLQKWCKATVEKRTLAANRVAMRMT